MSLRRGLLGEVLKIERVRGNGREGSGIMPNAEVLGFCA